jgi:hypothetical protein
MRSSLDRCPDVAREGRHTSAEEVPFAYDQKIQLAFTISNSTTLVAPVIGTITPGDLKNNLLPAAFMKYTRSVLLIASLDAASTREVSLIPSGVCSPVTYLPVQETCDFIAATDSVSVSDGAAGAFRVESTNNSQIRSLVIVTKPATCSPRVLDQNLCMSLGSSFHAARFALLPRVDCAFGGSNGFGNWDVRIDRIG